MGRAQSAKTPAGAPHTEEPVRDQPPLWPDGWEAEADRKAGIDPDAPQLTPTRSRPVNTIETSKEYL